MAGKIGLRQKALINLSRNMILNLKALPFNKIE